MIPAPSPAGIVVTVGTISILGILSDRFILGSRMEEWRNGVHELWVKLNTPGAKHLIQDANQLYCGLFDGIYGRRSFSWRRLWASSLSSIISLAVVTLILGYKNTAMYDTPFFAVRVFLSTVLLPLLNLIPDFFSLIETRLVLRWSKGKRLLMISLLLILDLVLTSSIFLGVLLFLGPLVDFVSTGYWDWFSMDELLSLLTEVSGVLPFFLTTFVTSLFWWLFVLTFGVIWIFHRMTPLANFVYREIGQSSKPVLICSAFLNSLIVIIYGIWATLAWLV